MSTQQGARAPKAQAPRKKPKRRPGQGANGQRKGPDKVQDLYIVTGWHINPDGSKKVDKLYAWYLRRSLVRAHKIPKAGDIVKAMTKKGPQNVLVHSCDLIPDIKYDELKHQIHEPGGFTPHRAILEIVKRAE